MHALFLSASLTRTFAGMGVLVVVLFLVLFLVLGAMKRTARSLAFVGALAALGLGLFWPNMFPASPPTVPPPTAEEIAARAEAEQKRQHDAELDQARAEVDQARAQREARIAAMVPRYAAMKPAERLAALAAECSKWGCSDDTLAAIERAGADDAERKRLHAAILRATDARDEKDARAQRETFAAEFERELLDKHLNPDRVTVSGPNKATLSVHIWLCSKQFLYDLQKNEPFLTKARARGFKRVACANDLESGGFDL